MTDGPTISLWELADALESSPELEVARSVLSNSPQATPPAWASALARVGVSVDPSNVSRTGDAEGPTAARRDSSVRVPVDLGLVGLGASAIRAAETLGPFTGISGDFWVDLFPPVAAHSVYEVGATRPAIVLTAARLPPVRLLGPRRLYGRDHGRQRLDRADKLDSGLPNDRYVGFTVSSGSLAFASVPSVTGDRLTCTAPLRARLDVTPADPAATPGGLCSAIGAVTAPDPVSVDWTGAGAEIGLGGGSATVAGTPIRFVKFDGTVTEDAELGAVVFGYQLNRKTFDCSLLSSDLVEFAGRADIAGGWALTLADPSDPDHPGEATSAGFYLLSLTPEVTAEWLGGAGTVTLQRGAPDSARRPAHAWLAPRRHRRRAPTDGRPVLVEAGCNVAASAAHAELRHTGLRLCVRLR